MRIDRQMLVAAVLAGTLALVGCGGSSDSGSKSDAAEKEEAPQEQPAEQEAAPEPEPEPEPAPETKTVDTVYPTTIDGVRLGTDYEGKEIVVVTFTWTNNSEETTSFASSVYPKVFQNGIECNSAISMDINNDKYMSDVRPGGSVTVEMAYEIEDHSDVEVEVSELFSFSDDLIASGTYSLQ